MTPWWCMNERTDGYAYASAFATSKAAINDQSQSLTNTPSETTINWKITAPLSALDRLTLECVIFTTLVKYARFHHKMTHNSNRQTRLFNGARSHQIFEFSQKAKQYQYGSVEVPFYLSTTAFSTLEMIDTMQSGANCTRVEYRLPRLGKAH